MLLGNINYASGRNMSNMSKVILTSLAVLVPGAGQLFGIIIGMIFAANSGG